MLDMMSAKEVEKETELEVVNPPRIRNVLGNSAMTKLIDFLVLHRRLDYSKSEIARNSGIGWKTLYTLWPTLEKYSLVKHTRTVGRAQLYRLNMDPPIAKTLAQLALQISDHDSAPIIKAELAKEAVKERA